MCTPNLVPEKFILVKIISKCYWKTDEKKVYTSNLNGCIQINMLC